MPRYSLKIPKGDADIIDFGGGSTRKDFQVIDIDRGYKKLLKRTRGKSWAAVLAGIFLSEGRLKNAVSKTKLAEYAGALEYGSEHNKAYRFMRSAFDENIRWFGQMLDKALYAYMFDEPSFKNDLQSIGEFVRDQIIRRIKSNNLLLTGLLEGSIDFRVQGTERSGVDLPASGSRMGPDTYAGTLPNAADLPRAE